MLRKDRRLRKKGRMIMTEINETAGKFPVISERRSEGIAGPSREVSKRDQIVPGAGGAGQENAELRWARRHVPKEQGRS